MKNVTLTEREEKMLELTGAGKDSIEMGKVLGYSGGTMRVYMHNLFRKIGVRNRTQALSWWMTRNTAISKSVNGLTRADNALVLEALRFTASAWHELYHPVRNVGTATQRKHYAKLLDTSAKMLALAEKLEKS